MARPSVRANPAWTKEVEELVHLARQARRRWTDSGLELDLIAYKAITNIKKRAIRRGTTRAWRAFADSLSNTNQVWRMTKWAKIADTVAATTPQFPLLQDLPDGELTYDRRERAEKLAKKFFPPPEPLNLDDIGNATYPKAVDITPEVTETMIMAALKRANLDKALGTDGITARMLKTCAKPLMPWLYAIFNACIRLGYHPEAFRASHTIVLRKPGKKHYTVAAAYRPIALLNTLGKILEGVIAETISKAVQEHQLLPSTQMGVRPKHSTLTALTLITEAVQEAWKKDPNAVISMLNLDLEGAFDKVVYSRLIHNLRMRRIPRWITTYIGLFLGGRTTVIKFGEQ